MNLKKLAKKNTKLNMYPSKLKHLIYILLTCCFVANGQQSSIVINAVDEPINDVLIKLRRDYKLQLSYNSAALTEYVVNLKDTFPTANQALVKLLEPYDFDVEMIGNVYVIITPENDVSNKEVLLVKGITTDNETGEVLPYCTVFINNKLRITDENGRFSYIAFSNELLHVEATFLGYAKLDSTYYPSEELKCLLNPVALQLKETKVTGDYITYGLKTGEEVGTVRLNQLIINTVGGNINNSIYNTLQLQPGVKAASGHANLSMWGSYQGQNQVLFDGISILNMSGSNPYFSAINPFMVKDILVTKGGSGAQYGDRVGGVVEITGIDGNRYKNEVKLSVDNLMFNGMISTPLKKNSSLVVAYRRMWLQDINKSIREELISELNNDGEVRIYPDRKFQDLHLKYSRQRKNGDQLSFSTYGMEGKNEFSIRQELELYQTEKQYQTGATASYATTWYNGVNSNFSVSYSGYNTDRKTDTTWSKGTPVSMVYDNNIDEFKMSFDNRFVISTKQFVEAGILAQFYQNRLNLTHQNINQLQKDNELLKFGTYIRNHIHANDILSMDIGLRIDVTPNPGNLFFQPRIKSHIKLSDAFAINVGVGIYNQYISQIEVIDGYGNYRYLWDIYGSRTTDVLSMDMASLGLNYIKNGWHINAETYYKRTEGLRRYITADNYLESFTGTGKSYGFDFLVKKDVSAHTIWVAYSTGKTVEYFDYFEESEFKSTIFDRRHELKAASVVNLNPVRISANYIFGSPIPYKSQMLIDFGSYQRFDLSFNYSLIRKRYQTELGLSVINLFDHTNRNNSNSSLYSKKDRSSLTINSTIPFMPVINLRVVY